MHSEEIADAVATLKKEGKIREFGLSNFTPIQTDLIQKHTKVDFNQIAFSATNYSPMLDGSLDHMQLHDIRPMAWNPLGSYFREVSDQTRRLTILLSDLAQKYNSIPETILLAWVLRHPADVIPVAGTVNVDRIRQLMKATEITLETEDWFAIWSESMGDKVP
jgi:predicted oxidoreductase